MNEFYFFFLKSQFVVMFQKLLLVPDITCLSLISVSYGSHSLCTYPAVKCSVRDLTGSVNANLCVPGDAAVAFNYL